MWIESARDRIYVDERAALAIAALSIAFGFEGINLLRIAAYPRGYETGVLLGAIVGFVVHELAHSWVGRKEGCIAHFVLSKMGLSLTILFGLLRSALLIPFVILAPGYVQLYCMRSFAREDHVAAAGPLVNILLAILAIPLKPYTPLVAQGFADINAWIALFNLLPFAPLDGWRIMRRNFVAWIAMLILAIILAYII